MLSTVLTKDYSPSHSLPCALVLDLCDVLRGLGDQGEHTVLLQFSLKPLLPGLTYSCRMKTIFPLVGECVPLFPPVYSIECSLRWVQEPKLNKQSYIKNKNQKQ